MFKALPNFRGNYSTFQLCMHSTCIPVQSIYLWWPLPNIRSCFASGLVSSPHPQGGKGLVYIERFLGRTGCSISCDWHDNASLWHGNASTAYVVYGYRTVSHDNHMQTTWRESDWCDRIPNWNIIKPQKALNVYHTFPSLRAGSGNETILHH